MLCLWRSRTVLALACHMASAAPRQSASGSRWVRCLSIQPKRRGRDPEPAAMHGDDDMHRPPVSARTLPGIREPLEPRSTSRPYTVPIDEARSKYGLDDESLQGLRFKMVPTALDSVRMFNEDDLRTAAEQKWGSLEALAEARSSLLRTSNTGAGSDAATPVESPPSIDAADPLAHLSTYLATAVRHQRIRRPRSLGRPSPASLAAAAQSTGTGVLPVLSAIAGNFIVFVGKLVGFAMTGSSSLLAETLHSLADTINQGLLAVGIHRANREASSIHPYGHAPERFVWGLISATGVFFLGAGASVYHGFVVLAQPAAVESVSLGLKVLLGSFIVEGITLLIALRSVRKAARDMGVSVRDYVMTGPDPMGVAVLLEDTAAVIGIAIAGASLGLTAVTGNPVYDALGSIAVGGLLGAVATFLINRNKDALLGRAMPPERMARVLAVLKSNELVSSVHDVKAVVLGVGTVRFKAEVKFDADVLATRLMSAPQGQAAIQYLQSIGAIPESEARVFLQRYSELLLTYLGQEIDQLEADIVREVPEVRYVDLELV